MKTVMQELIECIITDGFPRNEITLTEFDNKLTDLLEKEKQQIIDAYNQGYRDSELDGESRKKGTDIMEYSDAADYFDTKYNQQ